MARPSDPCAAVVIDTAMGGCGMVWGPSGVEAFALPAGDRAGTLDRLLEVCPAAVEVAEADLPADAARVVEAVRALLATGTGDLGWVPVVLPAEDGLAHRALTHIRTIPAGRTETYGEVAAAIGQPGAAQAVGRAMGANPVPVIVPCHRVVGADGRLVGFSADGGLDTKRRLLEVEGAAVVAQRTLF